MEYMKAVAVMKPNEIKVVEDVPIPVAGEYEALVKVAYCGFCNGTDMQIINGTMQFDNYPLVLGHEGAGEVIQVGKKVRNIEIGDRFIHNNLYPDAGNGYGKAHGGMAQYGLVVDHKAMLEDGYSVSELPFYKKQAKFSKELSFIDGAMLLTLCECMSAVRNFGIKEGTEVLIFGAGPMGTALAEYSRLAGAKKVIIVDGIEERLSYAKKIARVDETINFNTVKVEEAIGDRLFDVAIDAVGLTSVILQASSFLKPYGRVGALGVLKNYDCQFDMRQLKNNTMVQMLNFPYGEYDIIEENVELIRTGKIKTSDYYSHIVSIDEIDKAVDLVKSKQALKVIIEIDGSIK